MTVIVLRLSLARRVRAVLIKAFFPSFLLILFSIVTYIKAEDVNVYRSIR